MWICRQFGRVLKKIAKSDYQLRHLSPSVCPYWFQLDKILVKLYIWDPFTKNCRVKQIID